MAVTDRRYELLYLPKTFIYFRRGDQWSPYGLDLATE